MDQVQRAKIQAAINLANTQDKFVVQLRNAIAVGLTPEEIGRVVGLSTSEVGDLMLRWIELGRI